MPRHDREGHAWQTELTIEIGGPDQLHEVMALAAGCPDAPHWPPDAWMNFVAPSSYAGERRSVLLLGRAVGGELVGWLAASGIYETAELDFLLVHPAYRRRGAGVQLLEHWMKWARSEGALEALLEVRPSNEAAIRLYRGCGFAERGRRRDYYHEPAEDALLMWRTLLEDRDETAL